MTLDDCRKLALKHQEEGKKPLRFTWVGKQRRLRCEWLDPENGVFVILGIPGFIDIRQKDSMLLKEMKICELEKEGK